MAGKELQAQVVLNGRLGAGISQIENWLNRFGQTVGQVAREVIEFGADSVETYKNYETHMLAARAAMSDTYKSQTELDQAMKTLDQYAQHWAETTIFHTSDVAEAIDNAAHAGWTMEQQLQGIPQAMLLAQAGNMDLSTGFSMLARAMNVTGTEFENAGTFVDQWVKASHLANLTISDLGESMVRMGKTAQFAGNTAELFTMLDTLAQVGTVGSEAGTLLRSTMLRVIAPTQKAQEAMAALGAEADEIDELVGDEGLSKAGKLLEDVGFSAYDNQGNLKGFVDIFSDLNDALKGMTEEQRNAVISAIFPTRTVSGALAMLDAVGKMKELYAEISDSAGSAQKDSDIMMSGLMGSTERLASKWEALKLSVGEILSEDVTNVQTFLSGIIDKINGLDSTQLAALVGGMEALVAVSSTFAVGAGIMKFFTLLGPWGTLAALASVGIGALVKYLEELNEQNFENMFGDLSVSVDNLTAYADSIKTPFDSIKETISTWEQAVTKAEQSYGKLLTQLSEELAFDELTGKKLTADEVKGLQDLGESLGKELIAGIRNAKARDLTLLDAIFGNDNTPTGAQAGLKGSEVVNSWYGDLEGKAYELGQNLMEKIGEGMANGQIDRDAVQSILDQMNEIEAEITNRKNKADFYTELHKAGRLGWDSVSEYAGKLGTKYQESRAGVEDEFDRLYGTMQEAFEHAMENGEEFSWGGVTGKDWEQFAAALEGKRQEMLHGEDEKYGQLAMTAMDTLMKDSDWAEAWGVMKQVLGQAKDRTNEGNLTLEDVDWAGLVENGFGEDTALQLLSLHNGGDRLKEAFAAFKDIPGMEGFLEIFDLAYAAAEKLQAANQHKEAMEQAGEEQPAQEALPEAVEEVAQGVTETFNAAAQNMESMRAQLDTVNAQIAAMEATRQQSGLTVEEEGKLQELLDQKAQLELDISKAVEEAGVMKGLIEATKPQMPVELPDPGGVIGSWAASVQAAAPIIEVPVEFVATNSIDDLTGESGEGGGGLNAGQPTMMMFAEGGRSDVPAIFGEGNTAEWAIPEEHSLRTGQLLDAARRASGFTWAELIRQSGGGNESTRSIQINYAPVINGGNEAHIDRVLRNDKQRMESMFRQLLAERDLMNRAGAFV